MHGIRKRIRAGNTIRIWRDNLVPIPQTFRMSSRPQYVPTCDEAFDLIEPKLRDMEKRPSSSDNVPTGEDFFLGDFMLTENPTKKVVKRICIVKKNTANQSNPEKKLAISSDSGFAILDPQAIVEPRLSPQRDEEEAQRYSKKRKASDSPNQWDRTIPS
ncbi:hypothetical protein ACH5RR_008922 [Cinchona calisaya]|uniref:Uncharacterized protein n=1 Tax=Cinchona calisaya TaxID=153742 RepID=A0ABD3AGB9_9GENT